MATLVSDSVKVFEDIELHDTWIDWSDPSITPASIGKKLMGKVDYWKHEDFAEIVDDAGEVVREAMEPHEIEREILFEAGRDNWHLTSPYGKPYYQHFLVLMKLLDPKTDISPSIADEAMFFCYGIATGKKVLNLIGCQNAGKSAGSVRIAFVCVYIDPTHTVVYVANPFDNASDSTIWGEVEEMWTNICEAHPLEDDDSKTYLFPNGFKYQNRRITLIPDVPRAATIELRNIKHVGKYKGTKKRGKDSSRGIILVLIDEVNEIDNPAFLVSLTNLSSQKGFFAITSQNFKDEEDMGGRLCEPVGVAGGSNSYDELDVDEDLHWHSAFQSITLRLDGHRAPNILAGRTIYEYLFDADDIARLRERGEQSTAYYSQARSFPIRGEEIKSVLPRSTISNSRCYDQFFDVNRVYGRVAACDPSFGGKDRSIWGYAEYCQASVIDGDGRRIQTDILNFKTHFKKLRITKDAKYNEHWFNRLAALGVNLAEFEEGAEVSSDDQVAIQCAENNLKYGISSDNFGYDSSLRHTIVSAMNKVLGFNAVAFAYNLPPQGAYLQSLKQNTTDCCKNRVSELAFLIADLFESKQVRGGEFIQTAITQTSRTRYETKNKKYEVEDKKAYKDRWSGVSPDYRDVLLTIGGMVIIKGFMKRQMQAPGTDWDTISNKVWKNKKFRINRAKRI